MAQYKLTSPEGKEYLLTGPAGASKDEVYQVLQQKLALQEEEQRQHLAKTGFMPALKAAGRGALGSAEQALGEATNSEYLKGLAEEQKQKAAAIYEPTTEEDVAAAKERGIFPYLSTQFTKHISEPVGGIVGEYGVPTVGGIAAGALAPEAIGATAIAGMGAEEAAAAIAANAAKKRLITGATTAGINYPTTVGENIQAQKEAHPDEPINLARAALVGMPQSAMIGFSMPGGGTLEKMLGSRVLDEATILAPKVEAGLITREAAIKELEDKGLNFVQKMAANTATGTGMMVGTEELRRAQAGQELMTPEEIGESALAAGVLSPIFSLGHGSPEKAQAELKVNDAARLRHEEVQDIFNKQSKLAATDIEAQKKIVAAAQEQAARLNQPLALPFIEQDPYIVYPDGSVGKKSQIEAHINSLPEDQQNAARAKMLNLPFTDIVKKDKLLITDQMLADHDVGPTATLRRSKVLEGLDANDAKDNQRIRDEVAKFMKNKEDESKVGEGLQKFLAKLPTPEELIAKQKEAEDARLRAERDRTNIQTSGEPRYGEVAGRPTGSIRPGDTELSANLRPVVGGAENLDAALAKLRPEGAQEIVKSGDIMYAKRAGEIIKTEETPETVIPVLKERFGNNVIKALDRGGLKLVKSDEVPANVPPEATAYYDKGVAHLIIDRMTKEEAPRQILHETGVHFGLEGMLGKNLYRDTLRAINRLSTTDPVVKAALEHVNNRYKELVPGSHPHLEEVLAKVGESAPDHTLWRRVVAAIKDFLYKKGLWNPNRMDVRDIHDLINRSTARALAGKIKPEIKEGIKFAKAELPISDQFKDTAVFSPPGENVEESFLKHVEGFAKPLYTQEGRKDLGNSFGRQFLEGRIKLANFGAASQTRLIKDFHGAVMDATKGMRADLMIDQALHGNMLGAVSAKKGKVIFDPETGAPKVVDDPNNLYAIANEEAELGKKIGAVDAKHVKNAYLSALRYQFIIDENAKLEDKIKETKNKDLIKLYKSQQKFVSDEQKAAVPIALKYADEYPQVKKMAETYDKINKDEIGLLEKAGIISKEYADKLRATKGYAPLYRVMDDLESQSPGARQHFRGLADIGQQHAFEGSERQSLDIFDNMLTRHMWAVNAAVRNNANRLHAEQLGIRDEAKYNRAYEAALKDGKTALEAEKIAASESIYHDHIIPDKKDFMAPIWVNGVRKFVEYDDPFLTQTVHGLEPSMGPILGWFGKASKALRIGVTANPFFQTYQLFNDAPRAAMLSGVKEPFKLMGEVYKSFYTALKNPADDPLLQEMLHLGISGGFGHNATELGDFMRRQLGITANTLSKRMIDKAEKFAAASDVAQRRALFKRTLLETGGVEQPDGNIIGGNRVLAMDRAMNIIHWQKHGASNKVRLLTQVVPFLNAYIQGMDTLIRAMRGEGISGIEKKQAQVLFAQTALKIAALSTIYSMTISGNDEYEKTDDRVKIRSFIIPGIGKIPVASEVAMLTKAIPEMTWQYIARGDTTNPMDTTKLTSAIAGSFADGLLGPNLMPQALRAGVEVITNHDFLTGHPIVGQGMEILATSDQFTENTSELAKFIGKTGVISPLNLDHLLKGYGGTMASSVLYGTDAMANLFYNNKLPTTPLYRVPMIGSFLNSPEGKAQLNDYYDFKDRSDEVTATLHRRIKFGTAEDVQQYREDNAEILRQRGRVNAMSEKLKVLREQRKRIINDNISSDEKRAKLNEKDHQINEVVKNIGAIRVAGGL